MDYVLKPTLQHLSLAQIAIELWIQNDFLNFANKTPNELEAKVLKNVQNLPLPNQLKKELECFIKPIGSQIFNWFKYLSKYYLVFHRRPKAICWTSCGTIDRVKSIQVYLMERILSLQKRFELACDHCLVDEIETLWKEMTVEEKMQQATWCALRNNYVVQEHWINYLKCKPSDSYNRIGGNQSLSPYYDGCFRAIFNHNPTAILYFFEKLNSKEKELMLPNFRCRLYCDFREIDIEPACALLSRMNGNQQVETFKGRPEILLACLLSWPYQRFFLETAKQMWEFINTCHFKELLIRIIDKIVEYGGEYRYIFLEFWRSSPDKLKRSVIRPDHFPWEELYDCFVKGEEVCKMIHNDANANEKRLLLLTGAMRVNISIHVENQVNFFKILYGKNADPQTILWNKYERNR